MSLFNCEINLILTWSANCFIIDVPFNNQVPTFAITDTKVYVPAVTLSFMIRTGEDFYCHLIL